MSQEEFWLGNPQDFFIYKDLYEENAKKEQEEKDWTCWLQGMYNMRAFAQVNQGKRNRKIYPKEPFSETENKKNRSLKDKLMALINRVYRNFDKGE